MATFDIAHLRRGPEGDTERVTAIIHIRFSPTEDSGTVTLPDRFEGAPITHLGYMELRREGRKTDAGVSPARYQLVPMPTVVPDYVERLVIPASIVDVWPTSLMLTGATAIEVAPDNPVYCAREDRLEKK